MWGTSLPEYSVCLLHLLHIVVIIIITAIIVVIINIITIIIIVLLFCLKALIPFKPKKTKAIFWLLSSPCFEKILVFCRLLPFNVVCKCTRLLSRPGKSDLLFKTTPRPPPHRCPSPTPTPPSPPTVWSGMSRPGKSDLLFKQLFVLNVGIVGIIVSFKCVEEKLADQPFE